MTITINAENALTLLAAVVAEKGEEYRYPGADDGNCSYTNADGTPSCIVGHVLKKLHVPLDKVRAFEWDEDGSIRESTAVSGILGEWGPYADSVSAKADHNAVIILQAAQSKQDDGSTWGEALAYAQDYAKGLVP